MRQPRAKRAPRGPRVRTRGKHKGKQLYGIWVAQCKVCKLKFRVYGLQPKLCVACQSMNLETKPGRMNAQEKFEQNARFMAAGIRMVQMFLDAFGIPIPLPTPPPRRPPMSMSREEAARFIAEHAGLNGGTSFPILEQEIQANAQARDAAIKRAAKACHPDTGGSHELFVKFQEAKEVLNGK